MARLMTFGATNADVGEGDETWIVLADPEGNEFCVLAPRHRQLPQVASTVVIAPIGGEKK